MRPWDAARTFTAYLVGFEAFELGNGHDIVPYRTGDDYAWQLDGSNDFWISVEGTEATVSCRYEREIPVLEAMVTLFNRKHNFHLVTA